MVTLERREKEALLGRTIAGKFLIESVVGEGAMGVVYKSRQIALEKTVAIKVMHSDMASDELFVARFKREAKAASRLDHVNSMRVIDFGEDAGLLYIAMEFVDGTDLFKMIKAGWPLPNERVVDIMMQALAALAVAHDMGVVHRDLKPENIMILLGKDDEGHDKDTVKVCDFGIAKIDSRASSKDTGARLSTKGLVVGTPEYMSPEQGRGEPLDARSDLYSMGVILFQLLTGHLPFDAESALGIVLKHVTEEPPLPRQIYPSVDRRLEAICIKAMRKKKDARYQTAREMRADLKAMIEGAVVSAPLPSSQPAPPASGPLESAQTVRVPIVSPAMTPSPSKITPVGTEAFDDSQAAGVPKRGGLVAALILVPLLAAAALVVYFGVVKPMTAAPADSVAASSPSPAASIAPLVSNEPLPHEPAPVPVPIKKPALGGAPPKPSGTPSAPGSVIAASDAGALVPIDPDNARVGVRVVTVDHTTHQAVFAAVSAGDPTQCYQAALKAGAKAVGGTATLHIDIDGTGHITGDGLTGTNFPPGAGNCILQSMNRREVSGVTQPASADVELRFIPK